MSTDDVNPVKPKEKYWVLVADDDESTRLLLKELIQRQGYRVEIASTARDLIKAVKDKANEGICFAAIVADVNYTHTEGDGVEFPRLTGVGAIDEVKELYPDIPVIYVTGFASSLVVQQIRRQNADYFVKPFDAEAFTSKLDYVVNLSQHVYRGEERRVSSINHLGECRRRSDQQMRVPPVIDLSLEKARRNARRGAA